MTDHKLEAARAAAKLIKPNQTIGLGAGSTIAHLINIVKEDTALASTLTFTSSSFKTTALLVKQGLQVTPPALLATIDIYFDGCDQFDIQLNALKSGGGIHTTEKILAGMAKQFIIIGDAGKFAQQLDNTYPLVIEVLPAALQAVLKRIKLELPIDRYELRLSTQKDGAVISDNGNMLVDIYFTQLPDLALLNTQVKMIPGVVEHSLFYQMAHKAIISGNDGIQTLVRD